MNRFVVIGRTATASPDFLLVDIPGTSGRLDVLLRCLRAALLVSHGLRRDVIVYLVLLGGPAAPRTVRVDGRAARFVRPDEQSLATLVKKSLATPRIAGTEASSFVEARPGIAVAHAGLEAAIEELGDAPRYVLEEGAPDVRDAPIDAAADVSFFVGDHLGFDAATRARLEALGAIPVGLGPTSVHAEDAITILANELDRRRAGSNLIP